MKTGMICIDVLMNSFKFILSGSLISLISACASPLIMTYTSDPQGANIYSGHTLWGYAPITLNFQPTKEFKNGGCMQLERVAAVWASGAKIEYPSIQACNSVGYNQQFMLTRPDVPGREIDANFALQLDRNRIMNAPRTCSSVVIYGVLQTVCN